MTVMQQALLMAQSVSGFALPYRMEFAQGSWTLSEAAYVGLGFGITPTIAAEPTVLDLIEPGNAWGASSGVYFPVSGEPAAWFLLIFSDLINPFTLTFTMPVTMAAKTVSYDYTCNSSVSNTEITTVFSDNSTDLRTLSGLSVGGTPQMVRYTTTAPGALTIKELQFKFIDSSTRKYLTNIRFSA